MGGIVETVGNAFGLGSDVPDIDPVGFRGALRQIRAGTPTKFRFGDTVLNTEKGRLSLSPELEALRSSNLGDIAALRDRIGQGRNEFIQARVAPVREQFAQREAQLQRDLGRRGVFGTFSNQAQNRLASTAGDQIGRALGEATFAANQTEFDRTRQVMDLRRQQLAEELKLLGLSQSAVQSVIDQAINLSVGQGSNAARTASAGVAENQNQFGNLTALAGGVAGIADSGLSLSSLAGAFSDRRLKTDITQVGEHRGLPLYSFRYLWDDEYSIGHMADEVIEVRPDAVQEHVSGYLMVDYAKLWN